VKRRCVIFDCPNLVDGRGPRYPEHERDFRQVRNCARRGAVYGDSATREPEPLGLWRTCCRSTRAAQLPRLTPGSRVVSVVGGYEST
jgi:hypothetical protein